MVQRFRFIFRPGFRISSLRRQVLAMFMVTVLILLLAGAAGILLLVNRTEQSGWQGRQQEATQRVAQTVGEFLNRHKNLLQLLDVFGRNEIGQHAEELEELLRAQRAVLELVYIDSSGRVIIHAPGHQSVLANIFTIAQSNWFLSARKGEQYLGDIQLSARDEPYLIFAAPSAQGGVVAIRLRMEVLNEVISSLHFGKTGIAYLINQHHRIIAHSNPQVVEAHTRLDDRLLSMMQGTTDVWTGEYHNFQDTPVVGAMVLVPGTPWVAVTELSRAEAYHASHQALWIMTLSMLVFGIFLTMILTALLERQFLQPMSLLHEGVERIGQGDLTHRIGQVGPGEINHVAIAFDNMTEQLQVREQQLTEKTAALLESKATLEKRVVERTRELQDQVEAKEKALAELAEAQSSLLEVSRAAGMAEVATGVLHNVGNVLNSVNVSCTLLKDQLRESRVGNVSRVAGLIAEPEGGLLHFLSEDTRGRQIPAYLVSLGSALQEEHQVMFREAEALHERIEHIKEIVTMQQTYGRVSGVKETIAPEQLMEDALKLNSGALNRHSVTVQRHYESVPPITVDKHKVLQILLNLINNAKYACSDSDNKEKIITLRIFSPAPDCLRMQVADNGIGILPENMTHIFQHGFTTRKSGHGFGLHSGALAAQELGGRLTVHSDGPGLGARFTLELPCRRRERAGEKIQHFLPEQGKADDCLVGQRSERSQ